MSSRSPALFPSLREEAAILVRLASPIALAQLGLVTLTLVDTAFVGRVSVDDLAGASIGRSIAWAAVTVGMGLTLALEPIAAQAIGAGELGRAWSALRATLRASAVSWFPSVAFALGVTYLLPAFGVAAAVAERARAFLFGYAPAMLAFYMFLAGKTLLQAHHRTRPTLVASVAANAVNVVTGLLLVRGDAGLVACGLPPLGLPPLGALGAGLSSSVATFIMAAVVLYAARSHAAASPADPVPARVVVRLGVPIALQLLAEIGIFSLVAVLTGRFGAVFAAAHNVALGLASATFMFALGVADATAIRVGHAVGAGRSPRRAGLLGMGLALSVMSVSAVAFATFAEPLASLFSSDPVVVALGARLLGIAAIFQLFDGLQAVSAGALRGAGDVKLPFVMVAGAHWLVGLPVALGLGFGAGMGLTGLWWGLTAGLVTVSVALSSRFLWLSGRAIRRV